jgi:hypothetical protein
MLKYERKKLEHLFMEMKIISNQEKDCNDLVVFHYYFKYNIIL